jgi:RNA polymerase subunit RPABC4/transcription elongation factor Spt4
MKRPCLRCGECFASSGVDNRLCKHCHRWNNSEECPYSEGNYLYALTGEDAQTIQDKRKANSAAALHLHKKGA